MTMIRNASANSVRARPHRRGDPGRARRGGDEADRRWLLLVGHDIYIITVPTPVDRHNAPDLSAVRSACRTIGGVLSAGAIVVLESTVYPGATEEVVGPALAAASGLRCGVDFFLGYSPERINPGDRQHTVERLTKVVAGQTEAVTERLAAMYRRVTGGQVFVARDIRTAEAAKAIENAQRDINIAFVNEVAMICQRLGLSVRDVLDAARTKWNFLDFRPGLVGGHCIGVDRSTSPTRLRRSVTSRTSSSRVARSTTPCRASSPSGLPPSSSRTPASWCSA